MAWTEDMVVYSLWKFSYLFINDFTIKSKYYAYHR